MSKYDELKKLAEAAKARKPDWYSLDGHDWFLPRETMALMAVANPAAILELIAENERLQGERDLAVQGGEQVIKGRNKLKAAFGECVNSLHCEMLQKFGGQKPEDMHPVTRRDYDRDMAEIAEYRSVLEASK